MVLDRCRNPILKEVNAQNRRDDVAEQIKTLLDSGTIMPLKVQTIDTLNQIIDNNKKYYQAKIQSQSDRREKAETGG
jgi:hypothetical protein